MSKDILSKKKLKTRSLTQNQKIDSCLQRYTGKIDFELAGGGGYLTREHSRLETSKAKNPACLTRIEPVCRLITLA